MFEALLLCHVKEHHRLNMFFEQNWVPEWEGWAGADGQHPRLPGLRGGAEAPILVSDEEEASEGEESVKPI